MKALLKRMIGKAIYKVSPGLANQLKFNKDICRWVVPKDLNTKDKSTYVPTDYLGHDGIEMYVAEQLDRLRNWNESQGNLFRALRNDPQINTLCLGKSYLHNGAYPTPDAEIYAAMIVDMVPLNIVEIGAGSSTIIARKAINQINDNCELTVIDPEPRRDITEYADVIFAECVEDVELNNILNNDKMILFIDSSHVTRARGDIPYIYNVILPKLSPGTYVHVHDIFIPYDYPYMYQERLYTEQYVLQALLSHSNRYKIIFATHYMTRHYPDIMQTVFSEVVGRVDVYYGASLWFQVQ